MYAGMVIDKHNISPNGTYAAHPYRVKHIDNDKTCKRIIHSYIYNFNVITTLNISHIKWNRVVQDISTTRFLLHTDTSSNNEQFMLIKY